jgi:lipopolysaccharide transport system ATP-binding protein
MRRERIRGDSSRTDIIRIENLGKRYRIGKKAEGSNGRRVITNLLQDTFGYLVSTLREPPPDEILWALKDVSFSIQQGEVVGIIGRNGAGKSTLLKILTRITRPTTGRALLRGRVGSLLEVGTGFHPELTGRENTYLNGAILGMKRREIEQKFDEIVDFSGIEKFIDTPVKRYSSGMYVRLAFAVAAHLEPEILLIDEVLAVGDASFQRKCLGKIDDVAKHGRTVLFVSHSMPAITRLCQRAVLLQNGQVALDGPAHQVVNAYIGSGQNLMGSYEWGPEGRAPGNEVVRLCAVRVRTQAGVVRDHVDIRSPVWLEMEYDVLEAGKVLAPTLVLENDEGIIVFVVVDQDPDWRGRPRPAGHYKSAAYVPGNFFAEGTLMVSASLITPDPFEHHLDAPHVVGFQVVDTMDGDSARGDYGGEMPGLIRPILDWDTEFSSSHSIL